MKITGVKTFPITVDGRGFHFVKVETDEGIYGIGESGINSVGLGWAWLWTKAQSTWGA
jgi:hypothetical protein